MIRHLFGLDTSPRWSDDPLEQPIAHRVEKLAGDLPGIAERVTRSRGFVLGEFAARQPEAEPVRRAATSIPRRLAFAAIAATLVLAVTGGTIVASSPGMPGYDARLAVETLLLPVDPEARLTAQIERLDRRLSEATNATSERAVAAALRAYEEIALAIQEGGHGNAAAEQAVASRLGTQRGRIEEMAVMGGPGWRHALISADSLITWLAEGDPQDNPGGPSTPSDAGPQREGSSGVAPSPTQAGSSGGEQHRAPDDAGPGGPEGDRGR